MKEVLAYTENQCASHHAYYAVLSSANDLALYFTDLDNKYAKTSAVIPEDKDVSEALAKFWGFLEMLPDADACMSSDDRVRARAEVRNILSSLIFRSEYFWRSYFKPQGYSGDFRVIERMYELEGFSAHYAAQSAFVNVMDTLFASIPSVVALWERRRWLVERIAERYEDSKRNGGLTVLDIACGGARYLHDYLVSASPDKQYIDLHLFDQDRSALGFAGDRIRSRGYDVQATCSSISSMKRVFNGRTFNMIVISGLFDYFNVDVCKRIVGMVGSLLSDDGRLYFTNYHTSDKSEIARDWCADWKLVLKDEEGIRDILRDNGMTCDLGLSRNKSLIMATATH